jgi:hypothetical protein
LRRVRGTALGLVVAFFAVGCAGSPTAAPSAASRAEKGGADACQNAIQEASRLHNAAVDLVNAQRTELALNTFDQALQEWQRVTGGALTCPPDLVTRANDGLQKTQFERERALNPPR